MNPALSSRSKDGPRPGFALVVALGLMAFMFLLVMGLSSQLLVQNQLTTVRTQQALARQNALVGVHIALGQLQLAAGPDQRATATADILQAGGVTGTVRSDDARFWTGVWRTDQFGQQNNRFDATNPNLWNYNSANAANLPNWFVGWLVSSEPGENTDAVSGLSAVDPSRIITLVGQGSVDATADPTQTVRVPSVRLRQNETTTTGHFAYWIGDEGVKVNLAAGARHPTNPGWDPRAVHNQVIGQRPGLEWLSYTGGQLGDFIANPDDPDGDFRQGLSKSISLGSWPLIIPSAQSFARERFHEATLASYGLLADSYRGGLRRDLSLAFEKPDALFNQSNHFVLEGESWYHWAQWNESPSGGSVGPYNLNYLFGHYSGRTVTAHVNTTTPAIARGPSWHVLRDHFLNYKATIDHLSGGLVSPLTTRTVGPTRNWPDEANLFENQRGLPANSTNSAVDWMVGLTLPTVNLNTHWLIPRITSGSLSPVLINYQFLFSLRAVRDGNFEVADFPDNYASLNPNSAEARMARLNVARSGKERYRLQLIVDPVFVLWNPYSVPLRFRQIEVRELGFQNSFQIRVRFENTDFALWPTAQNEIRFNRIFQNAQTQNKLHFILNTDGSSSPSSAMTMQPGEVIIFAQAGTAGSVNWTQQNYYRPGRGLSPVDGGYVFEELSSTSDPIYLAADEIINIALTNTSGPSPEVGMIIEGGPHHGHFRYIMRGGGATRAFNSPNDTYNRTFVPSGNLIWPNPNEYVAVDADSVSDPTSIFRPTGLSDQKFMVNVNEFGIKTELSEYRESLGAQYNPRPIGFGPQAGRWAQPLTQADSPKPGIPTPSGDTWNFGYPDWLQNADGRYIKEATGTFNPSIIVQNEGVHAFTGRSSGAWGSSGSSSNPVVMFDIPRMPPISLGQLQHAYTSMLHTQPAYAVGNSWPSAFVPRDGVENVYIKQWDQYGPPGGRRGDHTMLDWSFLINDALWDGYYFSTLNPGYEQPLLLRGFSNRLAAHAGGEPLPNSRLVAAFGAVDPWLELESKILTGTAMPDASDLVTEAYRHPAEHLAIQGAFNVNSTSVEAWRALLASTLNQTILYQNNNVLQTNSVSGVPVSRLSIPMGGVADGSSTNDELYWRGFRRLDEDQINELAEAMVEEVILRGPFLSLSDFVNRRLENGVVGMAGPLQAAIDRSSVNNLFTDPVGHVSDNREYFPHQDNRVADAGTGITGNVTQADLLTLIGPHLSTRSDTFTIRSYGDILDPITRERIARAWCEVVVQRRPNYTDPQANEAIDRIDELTPLNEQFGRQFKIIGFRWLNRDDV